MQGQKTKFSFTGPMTALITPFRKSPSWPGTEVDERALSQLCERQIQAGISGLIPCGTTGESPTLFDEEKKRVIQITIEAAAGKIPVIAGVGSNSTLHTVELAKQAKMLGVDALLVVTPYYNRPTQEGLYLHYKEVTEVGLPIFLYNVPGRTSCDLLPDTIARLCELPQVIGVKEASGSVQRTQQILQKVGDRLILLSGDDAINYPLYCIGAKGCISVLSNVTPTLVVNTWKAFLEKNPNQACQLHYQSLPLIEALFSEPSPTPTKTALGLLGVITPELRPPLYPMTTTGTTKLHTLLLQNGLLV